MFGSDSRLSASHEILYDGYIWPLNDAHKSEKDRPIIDGKWRSASEKISLIESRQLDAWDLSKDSKQPHWHRHLHELHDISLFNPILHQKARKYLQCSGHSERHPQVPNEFAEKDLVLPLVPILETCLVGWLHPERKLHNVEQKFHIATVSPNKIGVWWQNMKKPLGSISWHGTWAKNHRSSNGAICSACRNKTGSARKLWRAPDYQTPPHRGRQTREFRQRHPGWSNHWIRCWSERFHGEPLQLEQSQGKKKRARIRNE